jgi:MoaA/NifB/PqqE/SkfB family radical SAM enzyme
VQYVPTDGISAGLSPTDSDRDLLAQRVEQLRSEHRIVIISFPGDEGAMGGCLAAGRGFFYIASDGRAEPCPFSPFSQLNLKDCSLKEALDSEFFNALRSSAVLAAHHEGGCALFDNRGKVAELCEGNGATKPQDQ